MLKLGKKFDHEKNNTSVSTWILDRIGIGTSKFSGAINFCECY